MRDVGSFLDPDVDGVPDADDQCGNSVLTATVVIGSRDSGVPNTTLAAGCTITDLISRCAVSSKNHGAFVSCVSGVTTTLKKNGVITGAQKDAITTCAESAPIP